MHERTDDGTFDVNLEDGREVNQEVNEEPISQQREQTIPVSEVEKLKAEIAELKDKFLRQAAEFDNYRKRNAKEKLELIQTASKDVIESLIEVLDDCERAEKQMEVTEDVDVVKEGVQLVFNKLKNNLYAKGLKPMESIGADFNPDIHEAVSEIPAPSEKLKGKVVAEVQKGYYLNNKIIRFAKVVVGK